MADGDGERKFFLASQNYSCYCITRFKRGSSGLLFAYSLHVVLFLIYSKMTTVLLKKFQGQFSQYHMASYVTMLLIILRGLGTFL